jgi:hypothetical protein
MPLEFISIHNLVLHITPLQMALSLGIFLKLEINKEKSFKATPTF